MAFCASTLDKGCVQCIPGTHLWRNCHQEPIGRTTCCRGAKTLLSNFDAARAVPLDFRAGEMSIHHVRTIHGSRPNRSDTYRIGFIINYITPGYDKKPAKTAPPWVRGEDRSHHFGS